MTVRICRPMVLAPALVGFALSSGALATSIPITPGLWEMKAVSSLQEGQQQVERRCIKETAYDPVDMLREEDGCEISNKSVDGNTITYDQVCADEKTGGETIGHFSFTIDGDQGGGTADMKIAFGGQSITAQMSIDAKRISDC